VLHPRSADAQRRRRRLCSSPQVYRAAVSGAWLLGLAREPEEEEEEAVVGNAAERRKRVV